MMSEKTPDIGRLQTGLTLDSGIRESGCARRLTNFIAHHPLMMIGISFGIAILLTAIYLSGALTDSPISGEGSGNLVATSQIDARRWFAAVESQKRDDRAEEVRVLEEPGWTLSTIYISESEDEDLFTAQGIKDIWMIERGLMDYENYEPKLCQHVYTHDDEDLGCKDPLSIVTFVLFPLSLPEAGGNISNGDPVPAPEPAPAPVQAPVPDVVRPPIYDKITEDMFDDLTDEIVKERIAILAQVLPDTLTFFGDKNYNEDEDAHSETKSKYCRGLLQFGMPVNEFHENSTRMFLNSEDDPIRQKNEFHQIDVEGYFDVVDEIRTKNLDTEFTYTEDSLRTLEIQSFVSGDFIIAGLAGIVVFFLIWAQTGSLFIAIFGIFNVLLSYPVGLFLYHGVLQIEVNTQMNLLSVYIILGIGADDIFVYVDAWKQSWLEGEHIRGSLETRVNWTWRRASNAMFITSCTTFVAFIMTAISPIPAISTFGILAALMILANYVLVITYFPAIVVLWSKKFERVNCCCKVTEKFEGYADGSNVDEAQEETTTMATMTMSSNARRKFQVHHRPSRLSPDVQVEGYRWLERFFYLKLAPFVNRIKYLLCGLAVIMIILGISGTAFLQPPEENVFGLPEESEIKKFFSLFSDVFISAEEQSSSQPNYFLWGVEPDDPIDRTGIDPNDSENLGTVNWDLEWKFGIAEQDRLTEICDYIDDAEIDGDPFVIPQQTVCFMRHFQQWEEQLILAGNFSGRTGDMGEISERLAVFVDGIGGAYLDYVGGMLNDPPELKWVRLSFAMTDVQWQSDRTNKIFWYDAFNNLMDEINAASEKGFNRGYQTNRLWVNFMTSEHMASATYQAIAVSFVIASFILYVSSGNYIVASISSLAILGIVVSTIGIFVASGSKLGWEESISFTILVGISVDYVVHLANAFNEHQFKGRYVRARGALLELGVSVAWAALTTSTSAFFLLFAQLAFFQVFGKFIFATILLALFWSVIIFMGMLMTFGPNDHKTGNIKRCILGLFGKGGNADVQKSASDDSESVSSVHKPQPGSATSSPRDNGDHQREVEMV